MNTKGIQTSEFWVTLIAANVMLFANALGLNLDETTVMSVTGMVITYIGGRSWFKGKSSQ